MRNRYIYMPFGDPGIYNEGPSLRHLDIPGIGIDEIKFLSPGP